MLANKSSKFFLFHFVFWGIRLAILGIEYV
jgi:hypothetical protein